MEFSFNLSRLYFLFPALPQFHLVHIVYILHVAIIPFKQFTRSRTNSLSPFLCQLFVYLVPVCAMHQYVELNSLIYSIQMPSTTYAETAVFVETSPLCRYIEMGMGHLVLTMVIAITTIPFPLSFYEIRSRKDCKVFEYIHNLQCIHITHTDKQTNKHNEYSTAK